MGILKCLLLVFLYCKPAYSTEPLTFRLRLMEDLGTLDWNYGEVNPEVVYQLMEGLFFTDGQGVAQKAVVKNYHWSNDKKVLNLELNSDRRWSDGQKLCAQEFVDSFVRLQSKEFGSPYAHYANPIRKMESSSCADLTVHFRRPTPAAPAILAQSVFFPIRLDQIKKDPRAWNSGQGLLVNGPYQVKEWKKSVRQVLTPNPYWAGKRGNVEKIEIIYMPEDSTAQILFEQDKLDFLKDVPKIMRTPELEKSPDFHIFPTMITYYFGLNELAEPSLKDPQFRQALSQALDRGEISKVLGNEMLGQSTWVGKNLFYRLISHLRPNVDFSRFKNLKHKLRLRIYSKPAHKLIAEWAQAQWQKKLGITVSIEVQEAKVYWKEIGVDTPPIFISGVTAPYSHPNALLQEFLTDSTANWTSWKSAKYDELVHGGQTQAAESLLEQEGFVIPLYSRGTAVLLKSRWKKFQMNPLGQFFIKDL